MDFDTEPARSRGESIVPMINVVFLLLIFFLITARIAPPEPFPVDLPAAAADSPAEGGGALWLAADGRIAFEGLAGEVAVAAAASAAREAGEPLLVRADRASDGATLARLLAALGEAGAAEVRIVTAAE